MLFETEKYAYVSQVSHPQEKHNRMNAGLLLTKVYDGTKLLCVVNLNHMFPVPKQQVTAMRYQDIDQYRRFTSDKEKNDYVALLKKEMRILRTLGIEEKARKLYRICCDYPEGNIARHCIDFRALEAACDRYCGDRD